MEDRFKFRAWDGKEMVGGDNYFIEFDGSLGRYNDNDYYTSACEVSATAHVLMQSTGLKDKNGKLIFEGDIIKSSDGLHVVEWHGSGCWNPFVFHEVLGYDDAIVAEYNEIVGNIHENPELLERKE